MLISCSACNSKYLVNSADLKPKGKKVKCAKCSNTWFQSLTLTEDEQAPQSIPSFKEQKNNKDQIISNLPSTVVNEEKASIFNSISLILFIILLIYVFWFFSKNGIAVFPLLHFYFSEFYFNLNLIITDIASIVKEILN